VVFKLEVFIFQDNKQNRIFNCIISVNLSHLAAAEAVSVHVCFAFRSLLFRPRGSSHNSQLKEVKKGGHSVYKSLQNSLIQELHLNER